MSEKRRSELVVIIPAALLLIVRAIDLFVYGEYTIINIVFFTVLALIIGTYLLDLLVKWIRRKRAVEEG